jgi:hypothetical protein
MILTWPIRQGSGCWTGQAPRGPAEIEIKRDGESFTGSAGETRFKLKRDGRRLLALVPASLFGSGEGKVSLEAHFEGDDRLAGTRTRADGTLARWQASRKAATPVVKPASTDTPSRVVSMNGYPSGEYARHGLPEQPRALLVRNARIWTNTEQGVLESADLLVEKGRIVAVGNGLKAPRGAQQIDATGLHLTPGHHRRAFAYRDQRQRQRAQPRDHLRGAHRRCDRSHRHRHLPPTGRRVTTARICCTARPTRWVASRR